jgi:hypothetical protein
MGLKSLKKEIEGKLVAKIQEVVLSYEPEMGKKVDKSITNASESISKKLVKYLTKSTKEEKSSKVKKAPKAGPKPKKESAAVLETKPARTKVAKTKADMQAEEPSKKPKS